MIFDDSIVYNSNPIHHVRMRIVLIWTAMRCPARVTDSNPARKRLRGEQIVEVCELSDCTAPGQRAVFECRNTRGVISTILKPLQRIQ